MLQLGTKGMKRDLTSVNHRYCYTQREAERETSQGTNPQDVTWK